ncbi:MAG: helix-turn-helix domain-containing protein [Candidatus Pacebacteria bacterium]|nr:helix-turn-helix domain-containing protein [Candidatus Paceibacterota bacterium]MDR3583331.1 helix-turn-helix domain-containing protein [Candidatus Paceibacterota bacterium]
MLENEIVKLGLSEKEAKVYLASLELGPSPVQAIAQKSQVNRATTYVVIDSLMNMGLMSTYNEGKKTYFVSEGPERLLELLNDQEYKVKNKIKILGKKMPELKILFNSKPDKPVVKYYEGVEGLRSVQMDFVNTLSAGDEIYAFIPLDDYFKTNLKDKVADITQKRFQKKIRMKIIYSTPNGRQLEYEKQEGKNLKEYLYIDYSKFPFRCGINIYGSKVFMIDYLGRMGGIVIENKTISDMLRMLFGMIWDKYKK